MSHTTRLRLQALAILLGVTALVIFSVGLLSTSVPAGASQGGSGSLKAAAISDPEGEHHPRPTRTHPVPPPPGTHIMPSPTRTPHPPPPPGTIPPPPGTIPPPPRTHPVPPPPGTWPPHMTPTPAILLVPPVQFMLAAAGETVAYHERLLNSVTSATQVQLNGASLSGWEVTVQPSQVVVQPGVPQNVLVGVHVPAHPEHPLDVERVTASAEGLRSSSAYLITIVGHHAFEDVPQGHWADLPVQYVYAAGIASGYSDGSFRPDSTVTRAQFAKMLVTAMGWQTNDSAQTTFSDVAPSYWAYNYIEAAAAHGAANGYADRTFRPDAPVTRAQIAKMTAMARKWDTASFASNAYQDVVAGDWSYRYASTLRAAGVMLGYKDGTFRPDAPATRAEAAKIISLALYREPAK